MLRILIAGLLGGVAMYVWSSVAHVATPLGQMGISTIPEEAGVVAVLKDHLAGKPGLYMYPTPPAGQQMSTTGPAGLLIYGDQPSEMTATTLAAEAVVEVLEAIVAAFLLSLTALRGYLPRVGFVGGVGLAAVLSANPSYWIWFKFPTDYTLAYMFIDLVGYVVAGLVIAAFLKPRAAAA
jgi:hypothetical protein